MSETATRTGLRIRAARLSERDRLDRLCWASKSYWGYEPGFMARCRWSLTVRPAAVRRGDVLVAERPGDGEPLGVAELEPDGREAELILFFVAPHAIGGGVGRSLFRAAAERARALRCTSLYIVSDPNAAAFYARMGAEPAGQVPSEIDPGRLLPAFVLALDAAPAW